MPMGDIGRPAKLAAEDQSANPVEAHLRLALPARGKIVSVTNECPDSATAEQDRRGAWMFPGAIDAHTHARGQNGHEGFELATKAAAADGVTTIVDMPYCDGLLICDAIGIGVERQ